MWIPTIFGDDVADNSPTTIFTVWLLCPIPIIIFVIVKHVAISSFKILVLQHVVYSDSFAKDDVFYGVDTFIFPCDVVFAVHKFLYASIFLDNTGIDIF